MSDQRAGFWGYEPATKPRVPPQPRFCGNREVEGVVVDVGRMNMARALSVSGRARYLWATIAMHDGMPAFSGGLLDSWPAWGVDAIAVARQEVAVLRAFYSAGGLGDG